MVFKCSTVSKRLFDEGQLGLLKALRFFYDYVSLRFNLIWELPNALEKSPKLRHRLVIVQLSSMRSDLSTFSVARNNVMAVMLRIKVYPIHSPLACCPLNRHPGLLGAAPGGGM